MTEDDAVEHGALELNISGETIEVDGEIESIIEEEGIYLVLQNHTDVAVNHENRNIIAYDKDGDLLWRIAPSPESAGRDNPFTGLGTREGRIIGCTWKGMAVEINTETGEWERYGLTK